MKNGNKLIMSNFFLNKKDNMYIRRKVFSLVENQENNYEMEERLYSTGDVELDELLERAFCEGYEFAQMEFSVGEKVDKAINYVKEKGKKIAENAKEAGRKVVSKGKELGKKGVQKVKDAKNSTVEGTKKYLGEGGTLAQKISGGAKRVSEKAEVAAKKAMDKAVEAYNRGEISKKAKDAAIEKYSKGGNLLQRGTKKVAGAVERNPRAAAALAAGTIAAGVGGGIYAARKRKED